MQLANLNLSGLPDFHSERLQNVLLTEEQLKPNRYDNKKYIVISKLELPKDKNSV